jgi:hypothetical protein
MRFIPSIETKETNGVYSMLPRKNTFRHYYRRNSLPIAGARIPPVPQKQRFKLVIPDPRLKNVLDKFTKGGEG